MLGFYMETTDIRGAVLFGNKPAQSLRCHTLPIIDEGVKVEGIEPFVWKHCPSPALVTAISTWAVHEVLTNAITVMRQNRDVMAQTGIGFTSVTEEKTVETKDASGTSTPQTVIRTGFAMKGVFGVPTTRHHLTMTLEDIYISDTLARHPANEIAPEIAQSCLEQIADDIHQMGLQQNALLEQSKTTLAELAKIYDLPKAVAAIANGKR